MKWCWLLFTVAHAGAAGLALPGPPFSAQGITIDWNAPTNRWPTSLWIYKVVPQNFSSAVVSNLMTLGGFSWSNRTHIEGQPPFKDKRMLYFSDKERRRHLGIFPPYGYIYYRDQKAAIPVKGKRSLAPTPAAAAEMALQYLRLLEVNRTNLVTQGDGPELAIYRFAETNEWLDPSKDTNVVETILQGVSFVRWIDGVSFTGRGSDGGFTISFGREGKVASLELLWRNLQRHKASKVLSPAVITQRIMRGKATMVPMTAIDLTGAQKLIVDKIVPYYLGNGGEDLQNYVYPFATLECTVVFADSRKASIGIMCPILADP